MDVREIVGRMSGAWRQSAELLGRNVQMTRVTFLLGHLLFAASWFVAKPNPLGSLLVWFLLQFAVWAGYHRYYAHRSFKTYPWFEFPLACTACLAIQEGPLWWASEHRHHHRTADSDADFHTPRRGFWHAHMGWLFKKGFRCRIDWDLIPDLRRRPIPMWVDRHQLAIRVAYALALVVTCGWSGLLTYWVVPVVCCWHTTFAGNSLSHSIGSHPAACPPRGSCAATNNALVALLNLGEGWHNNHHAYPRYAHHGFHRWYEVDIVYLVLLVLERLGVIWDVKRRPRRPSRSESKAVGGGDLSPTGIEEVPL